ncbi:hypothetical protein KSP40_PGU014954 [Platanthera guangdongensis]|uniref:Secreted protein n=1 Tax=Platanthera guangdongensis TaxID=2320717 RepID=A0ABR2N0M4_9ASPA
MARYSFLAMLVAQNRKLTLVFRIIAWRILEGRRRRGRASGSPMVEEWMHGADTRQSPSRLAFYGECLCKRAPARSGECLMKPTLSRLFGEFLSARPPPIRSSGASVASLSLIKSLGVCPIICVARVKVRGERGVRPRLTSCSKQKTFACLVPVSARVAFMSVCSIFWNFYLSSTMSR